MTIAIILLTLFLAATLIWGIVLYIKNDHRTKQEQDWENQISSLRSNLYNLETQLNKRDLTIAELHNTIDDLNHQDDKNLSVLQTQIAAAQERYSALEAELRRKQDNLAKLEISFSEKQKSLQEKIDITQEQRVQLTQELNDLREKRLSLASNFAAMQSEEQVLKKSLDELKNRYQLAIIASKKEQNELGIRFLINNKETTLINAISSICESYPELSKDLRKIEWEKIWRPKIQTYRSELSGVQGIYKLTLVSDEDICYIGQARDIYDRWFEHMKKMVGMDNKGNEKLYQYSIGDFWWKVLEEVEDSSKLNEAERYWIEYFGCVEVGLNKKV